MSVVNLRDISGLLPFLAADSTIGEKFQHPWGSLEKRVLRHCISGPVLYLILASKFNENLSTILCTYSVAGLGGLSFEFV
jgi:hypothetical protein